MSHGIPKGQTIGDCSGYAAMFIAGAYIAWFLPRRVRRDVQAGKLSEERARQKLKKLSPLFGYLLMVASLLFVLSAVDIYMHSQA